MHRARPERAAIIAALLDDAWSSYRANADGHHHPFLVAHHDDRLLVADDALRVAYRAPFQGCITEEPTASIRSLLAAQRA